ncbi:hypothetical protein LINPERHAP1_LOCUS30864 [Linum perenne]
MTYINDPKWVSTSIYAHHIIVRQNNLKGLFVSLLAFSFAANGFYLFLVLWKSVAPICSSEQDSEASAARASDSSHLLLDLMFDSTGGGRTNIDL